MQYEVNNTYSGKQQLSDVVSTINAVPFAYNYTYQYNWVNTPKGKNRRCDFDGDGYMILTDRQLTLFEDWKHHSFPLSQIQGMKIGFRKLAAPLIIGGIISPLSFVAAFNSSFSFWISMGCFIIGLLLFYYGLQGSNQVTIQLHGYEFKFFIDEKSEQVEEFIHYTNRLTSKKKSFSPARYNRFSTK